MARWKGKVFIPAGSLSQFGKSGGAFGLSGNIITQISAAGVVPGATGADNVIAAYTLPANAFDAAFRGINLVAMGTMASSSHTNTIKMIINPASATIGSTVGASGTTIASLTVSTTAAAGGWALEANIYKYGAAASNTQLAIHTASQSGSTIYALTAPSLLTATESSSMLIAITGNAGTTAADIAFNFLEIFVMN
jgi:hypothetical protein